MTSSAAVRGRRAGLVIVICIVVLGHGPMLVKFSHVYMVRIEYNDLTATIFFGVIHYLLKYSQMLLCPVILLKLFKGMFGIQISGLVGRRCQVCGGLC